MLIPLQDRGPGGRGRSGGGGRGRGAHRPQSPPGRAGAAAGAPAQLRPRLRDARPRSLVSSPPGGGAPEPRRPAPHWKPSSAVLASERPRIPMRSRRQPPATPGTVPARVQRRGELGPRPGTAPARPSCPPPNPWGPNTDCRHPHPGPARGRGWKPNVHTLGGQGGLSGNVGPSAGEGQGSGSEASARFPQRTDRPRGGLLLGTERKPATPPNSYLRPARPAGGQLRRSVPREAGRPGPRAGRAQGRAAPRARYARQMAPALRSAPPSRGAGAGGPKPSWP